MTTITKLEPLGSADAPLLRDIAAVLEKHRALDRISIHINHSHFNMRPGEVLLESHDARRRTIIARPVAKPPASAVPTGFALDASGRATPTYCCGKSISERLRDIGFVAALVCGSAIIIGVSLFVIARLTMWLAGY